MFTQDGFLVFVPSGFGEGKMMLFASDEEYYEWLEAQEDCER